MVEDAWRKKARKAMHHASPKSLLSRRDETRPTGEAKAVDKHACPILYTTVDGERGALLAFQWHQLCALGCQSVSARCWLAYYSHGLTPCSLRLP
jgi:hypothetical protein